MDSYLHSIGKPGEYTHIQEERAGEKFNSLHDQVVSSLKKGSYKTEIPKITQVTERSGWTRQLLKATTKGNNGKSFQREEIVWFNPVYQKALKNGHVPLHLSKKERHNNKVNPER